MAWEAGKLWPLISVVCGLLGLAAVVALVAGERVSAGIFLVLAILGPLVYVVAFRYQLRRIPDGAYGPITFMLSADGVEMRAAQEERLMRWAGVRSVSRTRVAWYFIGDTLFLVIPKRQLSEEQNETIAAAIDKYQGHVSRR